MIVYTSQSVDQAQYLARKLSETINVGSVVMLIGNLGTGKTTFVQGLAMAIGIKERVGSPTFKLVSEYEGKDYLLYHIDAYRLEGVNDFLNIDGIGDTQINSLKKLEISTILN